MRFSLTRVMPALLAAGLAFGCSTISHQHIGRPPPRELATQPDRPRALVIAVDGLRADVFAAYLGRLERAAYEPDWRSGLALLRREGFHWAVAQRAEATAPASGLSALATLATGEYADVNGIPGDTFYEVDAGGRAARYDFEGPVDGSRLFFGPALALPDDAGPALPDTLLRTGTWYDQLAPAGHAAVVFQPFVAGAEGIIPQPSDVTGAAFLPDQLGAAAAPLIDREVARTLTELLLRDDSTVIVASFREVFTRSCEQDGCGGPSTDLRRIQTAALRALDDHLFTTFARYRTARPEAFQALSVVLVGTRGVFDR
ncbi:MAG: alkaline phosphatase family protein, partial [Myxococcales bacterium]|nr:alkaline phosphatase family protein [Myxococcales bacterium]